MNFQICRATAVRFIPAGPEFSNACAAPPTDRATLLLLAPAALLRPLPHAHAAAQRFACVGTSMAKGRKLCALQKKGCIAPTEYKAKQLKGSGRSRLYWDEVQLRYECSACRDQQQADPQAGTAKKRKVSPDSPAAAKATLDGREGSGSTASGTKASTRAPHLEGTAVRGPYLKISKFKSKEETSGNESDKGGMITYPLLWPTTASVQWWPPLRLPLPPPLPLLLVLRAWRLLNSSNRFCFLLG